jgi:hypothetical protein
VLTADHDYSLHIDDVAAFNAAVEPIGVVPTRTSDEKDPEDVRLLEALRKEDE